MFKFLTSVFSDSKSETVTKEEALKVSQEVNNVGNKVLYKSVAPFPERVIEDSGVQFKDARNKSMNEIVQEIHETFFTEVDRLLADAKILKSDHTDKQDLLDKKEKLEKLGFISSKAFQEGKLESDRLDKIKTVNEKKQALADAINYFSSKYPMYKFITENSVKMICKKYNLVYSAVGNYIGNIPDKNIEDMVKFKISDIDAAWAVSSPYSSRTRSVGYEEHRELRNLKNRSEYDWDPEGKLPLEIFAPLSDFNQDRMRVTDSKLESIPEPLDPIVLQPVFHADKKYYLIVTAWGLEAEDPLVMNPTHN